MAINRPHTCATCYFGDKVADMVECHGDVPKGVPVPDPATRSVKMIGGFPLMQPSNWCAVHPKISGKMIASNPLRT